MTKWMVMILGVSFFCSNRAFIYEAKVLRTNDKNGQDQFVIGLSDFHDNQHPLNKKQQQAIEHILTTCSHETTKIVLEDLSSPGASGKNSCGSYYVDSRGGILGGLAQQAIQKGFEVDNVEFRYCRVASLGPILHNSHEDPHVFSSVKDIMVADIRQEIDAIGNLVHSYQDGHVLKNSYAKILEDTQNMIKKMHLTDFLTGSMADYISKEAHPKDRLALVKELLTFDSSLLDALLVHSVIHTEKKLVIMVAGGAHIDRVAELLKKSGYESVYETNVAFNHEHNVNRCLGSNIIEGNYCIQPQPIDLSVVEKYLR